MVSPSFVQLRSSCVGSPALAVTLAPWMVTSAAACRRVRVAWVTSNTHCWPFRSTRRRAGWLPARTLSYRAAPPVAVMVHITESLSARSTSDSTFTGSSSRRSVTENTVVWVYTPRCSMTTRAFVFGFNGVPPTGGSPAV